MNQSSINTVDATMLLRQYSRHTLSTKDSHIILIGRDQADVFTGHGWANRSRYRLMQGRWCHVNGIRLIAEQIQSIPIKRAA